MKKITLIIITTLLIISCKEKKSQAIEEQGFKVSGTVKGIDNVYIKMTESGQRNRSKIKIIDSVKITNGKFEFKGEVDHIDMVELIIDSKYVGRFMLENSSITMDIDATNLGGRNWSFTPKVSGSKSHDKYATIKAQVNAVFEKEKYKALDELRALFVESSKDKENKALLENALAVQKELMPLIQERMDERASIIYDFVRENPSSPVAVHVLGYEYSEGGMTKEQLKEFYHLFKGEAVKTGFYKYYMTKVYKDNFENLGVGNTAPDFTLTSVNGKNITLSKVEAKYKLVDFWASWCIPCRASFPHLMDLYKKYGKDGFEVVGVGTSDVEEKWRKAIEEDKTPWIHVFDSKVKKRDMYGPVAKKYGVPHLPTTFLMDSNQKIILRNPTKEELDEKLKELYGY